MSVSQIASAVQQKRQNIREGETAVGRSVFIRCETLDPCVPFPVRQTSIPRFGIREHFTPHTFVK